MSLCVHISLLPPPCWPAPGVCMGLLVLLTLRPPPHTCSSTGVYTSRISPYTPPPQGGVHEPGWPYLASLPPSCPAPPQGGVYELMMDDGMTRPDVVLKVLHDTAILGDLEKEWAVGAALNLLAEPDGQLRGFVKTLQAIRNFEDGAFRGKAQRYSH